MSAFSASTFDVDSYDSKRPLYPITLFKRLIEYYILAAEGSAVDNEFICELPRERTLLDVGCGPGNSTKQLYKVTKDLDSLTIDKFIGCDISKKMIRFANESIEQDKEMSEHLTFIESDSLDIDQIVSKNSIDIVTCAESVHWFDDINLFWKKCHTILKDNGGILAVWGYMDPVILEFPELDSMIFDLTYHKDYLGPYWSQPSRDILRTCLRGYRMDTTYFKYIHEGVLTADEIREGKGQFSNIKMEQQMKLGDFKNYCKTSSSYHLWKLKNHDARIDIVDKIFDQMIKSKNGELTLDKQVTIIWNSFLKLGTKKLL